MYVSREGYIFHSENINLSDENAIKNTQSNIKKYRNETCRSGNSIVLNNIFFDYGKSTIRESSIPELDRVVAFLQENPRLRVEISGHTCNTSSWGFNKKLSEARALSVTNYLVQKGIARNRIVAVGYSYDKPIASNATEEGKQKNRRTEFKIIQ
jgi:outer membrane protein OmpA-like peptidoglycan-associated protein